MKKRKIEPLARVALWYAVALLLLPVSHDLLSGFLLAHDIPWLVGSLATANAVYALLAIGSWRRICQQPERYIGYYEIWAGAVLLLIFDGMYAYLIRAA